MYLWVQKPSKKREKMAHKKKAHMKEKQKMPHGEFMDHKKEKPGHMKAKKTQKGK